MPTQAVSINFAIAGIIFAHCINAPTTAVDSDIQIAATVCTEPVLSWDERHLFFRSHLHRVQEHIVFVLAQLLNNGGIVVAKSIQQLRQEDLASNVSSHGASFDVFVLNSQFVSTSETKKE